MQAEGNHTDEVVRYLLGTMNEDERSALEDRILGDGDLFEQVEAAEADLLDAYARGELEPVERVHLEKGILASREGRARLEFAQALADRVRPVRPEIAGQSADISLRARILEWAVANRMLTAGALTAAALAVVALVSWISVERSRPTSSPEQAQQEPAPEPESNGAEPPRVATGNPPPGAVNANVQRRKENTPNRETGPAGKVMAFVFAPQTTRSVEELRVLRVPVDATTLRLRLEMATTAAGPYTAVLKTADGRSILRQTGLAARLKGAGTRVTVDLAASGLAEDEYHMSLVAPGSGDVVADYIFRIERE